MPLCSILVPPIPAHETGIERGVSAPRPARAVSGVKLGVAGFEELARLGRLGHDAALDRADLDALRRVERSDAFGAARRVDQERRIPGGDRLVRAIRLARSAVDASVLNLHGHEAPPMWGG